MWFFGPAPHGTCTRAMSECGRSRGMGRKSASAKQRRPHLALRYDTLTPKGVRMQSSSRPSVNAWCDVMAREPCMEGAKAPRGVGVPSSWLGSSRLVSVTVSTARKTRHERACT